MAAPYLPIPDQSLPTRLRQARALRRSGEAAEARRLEDEEIAASTRVPQVAHSLRLLAANRFSDAEALLRGRLARAPTDIAALCILGDLAQRAGIFAEAERLFRAVLDLAPEFADARLNLARVLHQQSRPSDALALYDAILALAPDHRLALLGRLELLGQIGRYDEAAAGWRAFIEREPRNAIAWTGYGNVLKTIGSSETASAFRRAVALDASAGDAWWGLANLKTGALDEHDGLRMEEQLTRRSLSPAAQVQIGFALGKAAEERRDADSAWRYYAAANALQHRLLPYDAAETTREVDSSCRFFTPTLFEERAGQGCLRPGPIFVVGMPRAGSTLIEQILASHSQVEGTSELAEIPLSIHRVLAQRWRERGLRFPDVLADMTASDLAALGQSYLDRAADHRRTDKPFFVDKLPNNWAYVGYIRLILPNARIIDARRDAMACCFSNFTQYFARGQPFSYELTDLGRYYRDYVRLMAHFETATPNAILRVVNENLVDEPEAEIRRLLDHSGLPFEQACLDFHANPRAVRTASAEQVRRPLNRAGFDRWRDYAAWLDPLAVALGPDLTG